MDEAPLMLISDDDPVLLRVLTRRATQAGIWVVPDLNSQALELAKRLKPSLVVLDLNQNVNGVQLLDELKADPETRDVQVAILTSLDDAGVRAECLRRGAAVYLLKPVEGRTLEALAWSAWERQKERARQPAETVSKAASDEPGPTHH